MKRLINTKSVAILGVASLALAACGDGSDGGDGGGDSGSNKLIVYSTMTDNDLAVFEDLVGAEFDGIEIEWVNGTAGELTSRMASEAGNPQGDMMWGGLDTADGDRHSDIFEHWLSDYEDQVQDAYKSPNGFYNVDHISSVAFAVNEEVEEELGVDIQGYEDLLDPALKGQIIMADPAASSSAWNNLSNIMAVYGNDSDEAWQFIEDLLRNDIVISSSSSDAFSTVEDGEYAVGLTYEDGIAAMLKSGAQNTRLQYPAEGTSASAFAVAVVEGGPNNELAKDVVNYLMSPEGQADFAEANGTVRMTTEADYTLEWLPADDEVTWVERDTEWLTENRDDIIDKWEDLYTEVR